MSSAACRRSVGAGIRRPESGALGSRTSLLRQSLVHIHRLDPHQGAEFDVDAHAGSSRPFELDATEAVRPGERNVVAVRVRRNNVNELGTGGILGPVMFYAPAGTGD